MQARFPEEDGEEARQGTAAHFYVTEAVQGRFHPVGTVTPNGVVLDDEMIECGTLFLAAASMAGFPRWIERKLTMYQTVHPACEGTPDLAACDHGAKCIDVLDYKYGHRYVDPYQNEQLVLYAAGVLEREGLSWDAVKGWRFRLTIAQPRNYHPDGPVRTWDALGWQVREVVDRLYVAARVAKQPDAPCIPNDNCEDCTARHACEALRASGYVAMQLAGRSLPLEMPSAAIGLQLALIARAETRLKAQRTGLEEIAKGEIRAGRGIPGWGIKQGVGRKRWTVPPEMVATIGQGFGVNLTKPATLTPVQAVAAGIPPAVVKEYSEDPPGEHKLVPMGQEAAAKAFGVPAPQKETT